MEDPGYFGAIAPFHQAGARIICVPVDEAGLSVSQGEKLCKPAKAAYLTPAHQFPLGMAMPVERRIAVLKWARETGAFLIEDDYDSEYRFDGRPMPALLGLDKAGSVIFLGSFNKVLFPSLRLGYLVLPPALLVGLRQSDAIFARNLLGATPAEAVRASSWRICSRMARATTVAVGKPVLFSVTSR